LRSVQPLLRRYLVRLTSESNADDVLQDVLLTLCRKIFWLRNPNLFRPWAYRIASRAAFRHLKNERVRSEQVMDDFDAIEQLETEPVEDSRGILEMLLTLESIPPASRAVLLLHFQEELSLPEVAGILAIPLGTAKSRLASGLAMLRKHLGKDRSFK